MNRKGELAEQFTFILMMVAVLALIIAIIALVGLAAPPVIGEGKVAINQIQTAIHTNNPGSSLENSSSVATQAVYQGLGAMEILSYLMFIGLFVGYLIIAYYVRTYPYLAFVWIGLVVILVMLSIFISIAYQNAKATTTDLNNFYTSWGTNDFLLSHLPELATVLGLISMVLLFAIRGSEPQTEEGLTL